MKYVMFLLIVELPTPTLKKPGVLPTKQNTSSNIVTDNNNDKTFTSSEYIYGNTNDTAHLLTTANSRISTLFQNKSVETKEQVVL